MSVGQPFRLQREYIDQPDFRPIAARARLIVDSTLAASSVGVLSWFFLVSKLWGNPDVAFLGKIISVAYPLGDIAVLLCAIMLMQGSATNRSLRRSRMYRYCCTNCAGRGFRYRYPRKVNRYRRRQNKTYVC